MTPIPHSAQEPVHDGRAIVLPWFAGENHAPGALADSTFLAAVVLLSCVPYVAGLGLYSDDWAFMAAFHGVRDTFPQLLAAIMPIEMATRPVQAVEMATLYGWFGPDPFGWHIVNALVLAGAVVLFHLSLRALGFARPLALLVPLIFGLLPHYSTDRVWIAAFQANASMFLYFLSLFADVRFVLGTDARRWLWKVLGSSALAASVLAYEVTAPLLVLNLLVLAFAGWRLRPSVDRAVMLGIATNVTVLAGTVVYKFSTTVRADATGGYLIRVLRIVREAVPVHFGEYGVALPVRVAQVLRDHADPVASVLAALIGLAVGWYLLGFALRADRASWGRVKWPAVVLLGFVLFAAGYGVTLTTWEIGFHTTGPNNRTAIAAGPGVAFVFVGVLGWICTVLPWARVRRIAPGVLAGLLAASCALITAAVADHWVRAADAQDAVIGAVRERFPLLPPGTTLLLDGLCPFIGPAPVFATSWDVTGMLQTTYDELDLRGDVIKPNTEATPEGIRTMLFDDVINVYPYGDDLVVQHMVTGEVLALTSAEMARTYLNGASARARPACKPYTDGDGEAVF